MTRERSQIDQKLRGSITVADLISELAGMDPKAVVLFACDYGDMCHTQQALPVTRVEEMQVSSLSTSAYSQSGLQLIESDEELDDEELETMTAEEKAEYEAEIGHGSERIVILQ